MIHLLATDMDGTLLNSQKEFDNEFFEVLQKVLDLKTIFRNYASHWRKRKIIHSSTISFF